MTPEDYILILDHQYSKITDVVKTLSNWRVVPGVLPFADRGEFFSSWVDNPTEDTRDSIEGQPIKFIFVYLTGFEQTDGPVHSPLMEYVFRIYMFQEFTFERHDEDEDDPAEFVRLMFREHNEFAGVMLGLQWAYQGNLNMGIAFSEPVAVQETVPLRLEAPSQRIEECEFIPDVEGFQASLESRVRFQLTRC